MVEYGKSFSGGDVFLPPSKSAAHRALLCAALSGRAGRIFPIDTSKDMEAMLGAVCALGAKAVYREDQNAVLFGEAAPHPGKGEDVHCLESGNTLRFVTPVAAALGGEWLFTGSGRLPERPMSVYRELFPKHGTAYSPCDEGAGKNLPLKLSGKLLPGVFEVPGNISSQFISGLLFALPLLEEESEIILTTPLESEGYVTLTLAVLRAFGIECLKTERGWKVPGGQTYRATEYRVEGDWSQAAFFLSMAALSPGGKTVRLHGLDRNSAQGDKACVSCFEAFGLSTRWEGEVLAAWNPTAGRPFGGLRGTVIDASQINDLVPALAVCGALSEGETRIIHAERLRLKESDRLAAMREAINSLGGNVRETEDGLSIQGVPSLRGGTAEGKNDHRVVMALAAAALRCNGPLFVTDEHSIQKTYPGFFKDFKALGGTANVFHVG